MKITVTEDEQKAIKSLKRLAKKWPSSLSLFSWAGDLCVVKNSGLLCWIKGIDNDGGDAGDPAHSNYIEQHPEIELLNQRGNSLVSDSQEAQAEQDKNVMDDKRTRRGEG